MKEVDVYQLLKTANAMPEEEVDLLMSKAIKLAMDGGNPFPFIIRSIQADVKGDKSYE